MKISCLLLFMFGFSFLNLHAQEGTPSPETRILVNPGLLALGEFGLIFDRQISPDFSGEVKLAYEYFPEFLSFDQFPAQRGPVVQLGFRKHSYFNNHNQPKPTFWGVFLFYKNFSHDMFYFPVREEFGTGTSQVLGTKLLVGRVLRKGKLHGEYYYGLGFRSRWGQNSIYCAEVGREHDCIKTDAPLEVNDVFGFFPTVHFGIRAGLRFPSP